MFNSIKKFLAFLLLSLMVFVYACDQITGKKETSETESMAAKKSQTLDNTKNKGFVRCGVSQGLPGFSNAEIGRASCRERV